MAHLQKLKDKRDSHIKIRERDSETMLTRLMAIESGVIQKQNHQIYVAMNKIGANINPSKNREFKDISKVDLTRKRMKSLESHQTTKSKEQDPKNSRHSFQIRVNTIHRSILQ